LGTDHPGGKGTPPCPLLSKEGVMNNIFSKEGGNNFPLLVQEALPNSPSWFKRG